MNEEYLTIQEFANIVKVHHNTIRRQIKKGRIQALQLCKGQKSTWRIARSEINRIVLFDLEEMIEKIVEKKKNQEVENG